MEVLYKEVKETLEQEFDSDLVTELLKTYRKASEYFLCGRHRPCAVECAHFSEVVARMLQEKILGTLTPLTEEIKFDQVVNDIMRSLKGNSHISLRIQIPRTILLIHTIRNKRKVGHVSGDVDENHPDAILAFTCASWVLAELFRLHYKCNMEEAQDTVNGLLKRRAPMIQDFDGFPKILNPKLKPKEKVLLWIYQSGENGAAISDIKKWAAPRIKEGNVKVILNRLEYDDAFIHRAEGRASITVTGILHVEDNIFKVNL